MGLGVQELDVTVGAGAGGGGGRDVGGAREGGRRWGREGFVSGGGSVGEGEGLHPGGKELELVR